MLLPAARSIPSLPVSSLLERAGWAAADMLLCDTAGSEAAIFADPGAPWLAQVETAAIDLDEASAPGSADAVRACFPAPLFTTAQEGATLVFRRRNLSERDAPPRHLPLIHAGPGLLPFHTADAAAGARLLGETGLAMTAPPHGQPPSRVAFPRTLSGQTHLHATLRHSGIAPPFSFAATLADAAGNPLARATATLAPGAEQGFSLVFPQPCHGRHRLLFEVWAEAPGPAAEGCWLAPVLA